MAALLIWYEHAPVLSPLRTVSGLTLVRRAVLAGQAAGFDRIVVATREEDGVGVRRELHGDRRIRADVTVVPNPATASAALSHLPDGDRSETVVVAGDRVWTAPALKALIDPLADGFRARLTVASDADDAEPSGMVRVRGEDLDRLPLHAALAESAVRAVLGEDGVERRAVGPAWRRVRDRTDVRDAETLLLRALVKPADGIVSRNINRKISTFLSRRLARRAVHPNHVTAVVFAVGILAGPFAFLGSYAGFLLGGLCYYVSAILDGCDGELSRLKYLGSPLGAWLDTVTDDVVGLSWLVGLYLGLARHADHPVWAILGWVAVPCYLLTILPRYYLFATGLGAGDHQKLAAAQRSDAPGPLLRAVYAVRDVVFRTDFLPFAAFVTAAAGGVWVFAAVYAPGAVAAFGDTVVTLVRFRPRRQT
jgi:phosphatidylglycerophosphate synthase/CTP:molybdopterin cytidylyltransferase MocA